MEKKTESESLSMILFIDSDALASFNGRAVFAADITRESVRGRVLLVSHSCVGRTSSPSVLGYRIACGLEVRSTTCARGGRTGSPHYKAQKKTPARARGPEGFPNCLEP
jgi:hypothetical protein